MRFLLRWVAGFRFDAKITKGMNSLKRFLIAVLSAALALCVAGCKAEPLLPEQQRLLVFGAVLAQKNGMGYEQIFAQNASFKDKCKDTLASAWEITDNASARLVLDWLFEDGVRAYSAEYYNADEILEIAVMPDEAGEEALTLLKERLDSYNACVQVLKDDYGYTDEVLENVITTAAFDYDRLVTLARWCYACEYLSEAELWTYAQAVAYASAQSYESWQEYFAAIALGKAITTGDGFPDAEVADALIESEDSPYAKYSFLG